MTQGEQNLLNDLNEFVRNTANLLEDRPQTTGIRQNPVIESSESSLVLKKFGGDFAPVETPESTLGIFDL